VLQCGRIVEDYQMKIRTQDNSVLHRVGRLECGYVEVCSTYQDPVLRTERSC